MTEPLTVDPAILREAGKVFETSGDGLQNLRADAPLGDAAAGIPDLSSAAACLAAQASLATQATAASGAARSYGSSLGTAAGQYAEQDQAAAGAIASVRTA